MDIKSKLISKIESIHNDEIVVEIYEWVEALLAESTERKFSEDEIEPALRKSGMRKTSHARMPQWLSGRQARFHMTAEKEL